MRPRNFRGDVKTEPQSLETGTGRCPEKGFEQILYRFGGNGIAAIRYGQFECRAHNRSRNLNRPVS